MKETIIILSILLMPIMFAKLASATVIISEVYYDPVSTESGGEAVELYNPTGETLDISGYAIKTESSDTDATLPDGALISPDGYYLVADTGFSENKDDPSWPDADHEETLTMSNTDSGVAIVDRDGITIDAVGWGDPLGIEPGLYEGTPASPSGAGESLQKTEDTDDNFADYISAAPELKNSLSNAPIGETSIQLEIEILERESPIISVSAEDEDKSQEGVQIIPLPGQTKEVPVSVNVNETTTEISSHVWIEIGNQSYNLSTIDTTEKKNYTGSVSFDFHEPAGVYNATAYVKDSEGITSTEEISFDYLELNAIDIDTTKLRCVAKQGEVCEISGDTDLTTPDKITVRNTGNSRVNFLVKGSEIKNATETIGPEIVEYSFGDTFLPLSTTENLVEVDMMPGPDSKLPMSLKIDIPTGKKGTFAGVIDVIATGV